MLKRMVHSAAATQAATDVGGGNRTRKKKNNAIAYAMDALSLSFCRWLKFRSVSIWHTNSAAHSTAEPHTLDATMHSGAKCWIRYEFHRRSLNLHVNASVPRSAANRSITLHSGAVSDCNYLIETNFDISSIWWRHFEFGARLSENWIEFDVWSLEIECRRMVMPNEWRNRREAAAEERQKKKKKQLKRFAVHKKKRSSIAQKLVDSTMERFLATKREKNAQHFHVHVSRITNGKCSRADALWPTFDKTFRNRKKSHRKSKNSSIRLSHTTSAPAEKNFFFFFSIHSPCNFLVAAIAM